MGHVSSLTVPPYLLMNWQRAAGQIMNAMNTLLFSSAAMRRSSTLVVMKPPGIVPVMVRVRRVETADQLLPL